MVLHNVHILNHGKADIVIDDTKIVEVVTGGSNTHRNDVLVIEAGYGLAFPGLINSHDHLEFNLFPQLGNGLYKSYMYWGGDIHTRNTAAIQEVLKVPEPLRARWGVYKNLLCGITTVVQHGKKQVVSNSPVQIFNGCHSLHSVGLEKHWRYKLNRPFALRQPFVIHAGEGTDEESFKEIDELLDWNFLRRELIGIHGVAMSTEQAAGFKALVWCPESNYFLLGATAKIDALKANTKILFGTDSTLSASWNIWQHLYEARATGMLADAELFDAVTRQAAEVWNMQNTGVLQSGYYADIVVAERNGNKEFDAFFGTNPESILLVVSRGNIVFFDASFSSQLGSLDTNGFSKVYINGRCKYVKGDVPALIKEIKTYSPGIHFPVEIE